MAVNFDRLNTRLKLDLADAFATSTRRAIQLAGRQFAGIVDLYVNRAKNQNGLARVNRFLAAQMRVAVLDAYNRNVLATSTDSYRKGQNRYSGGQLLRALQSESMAVGTSRGIGFIDTNLLNQKARFWARLNFGADPNIGRTHGPVAQPQARVQWGSNQGFSLRLAGEPRPGFAVPDYPGKIGYFIDRKFFVGKPPKSKRSSAVVIGFPKHSRVGIGARRFLDAGLVRLAQEFKPAYQELLTDASRRAVSRNRSRRIRA
jgi:hypothetical protein